MPSRNTYHLTWVSLTLDVGYLFMASPPDLEHEVAPLGWNAKLGSQETPGLTDKFGLGVRNKAGQRLIEFCQDNALVIASTLYQQHKRRLYTWASPDGQHQNQIDYILCSKRWRSSIQSAKTRPGADCDSDHELLMPNSDLKKVGKTTRPFSSVQFSSVAQ